MRTREADGDIAVLCDGSSSEQLSFSPAERRALADPGSWIGYQVDAREDWRCWFTDAFYALQQVSCRLVAKEWIKTIQPRKQYENPYNGVHPVTAEYVGSCATRPPYWPASIVHREPDHISKEGILTLLFQLIAITDLD